MGNLLLHDHDGLSEDVFYRLINAAVALHELFCKGKKESYEKPCRSENEAVP
jgi:hypothetical protein